MIEKPTEGPLKALIEHATLILELGSSALDSCIRKQKKVRSNYRIVLSAYAARSYELFESIIILIKNDRITDAGILLRCLVNLLINLAYIDYNKEERASVYLYDIIEQELKRNKKSKNFFVSIGKGEQVARYIKHYEKEKEQLSHKLKEEYPQAKPWEKIHISEKANVNQEVQYIYHLLYADLSRYEHYDFSAAIEYVNPASCNPILRISVHSRSPALNHRAILMFSCVLFGIVLEFFDREYQLKMRNRIDEMAKKLSEMEQLRSI